MRCPNTTRSLSMCILFLMLSSFGCSAPRDGRAKLVAALGGQHFVLLGVMKPDPSGSILGPRALILLEPQLEQIKGKNDVLVFATQTDYEPEVFYRFGLAKSLMDTGFHLDFRSGLTHHIIGGPTFGSQIRYQEKTFRLVSGWFSAVSNLYDNAGENVILLTECLSISDCRLKCQSE